MYHFWGPKTIPFWDLNLASKFKLFLAQNAHSLAPKPSHFWI